MCLPMRRFRNFKLIIFVTLVFSAIICLELNSFFAEFSPQKNKFAPVVNDGSGTLLRTEIESNVFNIMPDGAIQKVSQLSPIRKIIERKSEKNVWLRQNPKDVCVAQFGNGFEKTTNFCKGNVSQSQTSTLKCLHNENTLATMCLGSNLSIDTGKVKVSHGNEEIKEVIGRAEEKEMPVYERGAFKVACSSSSESLNSDFPHYHHLVGQFEAISYEKEIAKCDITIDEPTLLVTRYEYANVFHSMLDFYNTYQAQQMSGHSGKGKIKIIFMDGHSKGALDDIWSRLFGEDVVKYIKSFGSKLICLKEVIFVSPGYQSALGVFNMENKYDRCRHNPPLHDFIRHFKHSFEKSIQPSDVDLQTKVIRVTLIFRRDYMAHPRVNLTQRASRKISNEFEVVNATRYVASLFKEHAEVRVSQSDFASLSLDQQMSHIFETDILIGVHGAALTYTLFLPKHAVLVELVPADFDRPHFRYFATWADKGYQRVDINGADAETGEHWVDVEVFSSALAEVMRNVIKNKSQ